MDNAEWQNLNTESTNRILEYAVTTFLPLLHAFVIHPQCLGLQSFEFDQYIIAF